jgi:hypothetical protein
VIRRNSAALTDFSIAAFRSPTRSAARRAAAVPAEILALVLLDPLPYLRPDMVPDRTPARSAVAAVDAAGPSGISLRRASSRVPGRSIDWPRFGGAFLCSKSVRAPRPYEDRPCVRHPAGRSSVPLAPARRRRESRTARAIGNENGGHDTRPWKCYSAVRLLHRRNAGLMDALERFLRDLFDMS